MSESLKYPSEKEVRQITAGSKLNIACGHRFSGCDGCGCISVEEAASLIHKALDWLREKPTEIVQVNP